MNELLLVVFYLAIFTTLLLSIWYTGRRLCNLFKLDAFWTMQIFITAGVVGSVGIIIISARSTSILVGNLSILGGYILTFYVYLILTLLLSHIIQIIWKPSVTWVGISALFFAFAVTATGAIWANILVIKETKINIEGLKKEINIMHISDVHLGHHRARSYLANIVEKTNMLKPDIVLITGDLVDSNIALSSDVLDLLSNFTSPVYFVGGNHENYIDTKRAFELIEQYGVRILRNEVVELQDIQIIGLDYMNADENTFDMHPSNDTRTIKTVLSTLALKTDIPSILMHHSPVGIEYAVNKGVDLMISGHTHAGQVFPFTLFISTLFPFNDGLYRQDKTNVFVTQGAGTYMLRVRLGTSNEINLLRLIPDKR
ncbi:MAG: metallophosphoesterase [Campylobacteraceae bacterium]|jgi:predicted MPP superfamily phosphohydrolase|nr:metallophosphoesterase [Campylobacteraceae bacterium]